jgi:hypothetical protein
VRVPSNFINLGKCNHISPGSLTSWESYLGPIPIIHPTSNSTSAAVTALVKAFPVACTITSVAGQPLVSKVRCRLTLEKSHPRVGENVIEQCWTCSVKHHMSMYLAGEIVARLKLNSGLICLFENRGTIVYHEFPYSKIQRAIFHGQTTQFSNPFTLSGSWGSIVISNNPLLPLCWVCGHRASWAHWTRWPHEKRTPQSARNGAALFGSLGGTEAELPPSCILDITLNILLLFIRFFITIETRKLSPIAI